MANIKAECFLIAYKKKNSNLSFCFDNKDIFNNFSIIKNKFGCWAADPFLLDYNNKTYLFAEIFNCFSGKGHIEVCCLTDKKIKWKRCKISRCHLSFPNVQFDELFKRILMIPETNENRNVSEYECIRFPDLWQKRKILLANLKAVDSVCYNHNGREYLFTYILSKNNEKKLCIFENVNDNFLLAKEIVDKEKILRPAGKLFVLNNKIILPTQNCKSEYGSGIIFNEIDFEHFEINPIKTIFGSEVILKNINKTFCGIHTYNTSNNFEVIDLKYKKFSFLRLLGAPFRKIFKTRKK